MGLERACTHYREITYGMSELPNAPELSKALGGDKGNISHSLRTLEARGWIVLGRTPGGRAESPYLTPTGLEKASEICTKL